MIDEKNFLEDLKKRMNSALENFSKELTGLRTGRASVSLLEPLMVDAYGSLTPLTQVANVNAADARMLSVSVWDQTMVKLVEKAIRESGLGLNPVTEGQTIRVPIPDMSQERRQELVKVSSKYTEQARVFIRNLRRDGMDNLKKLEKDNKISEDEHKKLSEKVQTLTDDMIKKADQMAQQKEKDILQI
jgi:ribosome recycling factor